MIETNETPSPRQLLQIITNTDVGREFGAPLAKAFARCLPQYDATAADAAAIICTLFLSAFKLKYPTERLHTFVHEAAELYPPLLFDCKMYDTLLAAIEYPDNLQILLLDHKNQPQTIAINKNDIMEAFDFLTNK